MCGFLAEFTFEKTLSSEATFKAILQMSQKRGPDHQGYFRSENFQIGFNRLSIQDLSTNGNQPMWSPTRKFILTFNGEIYNARSLANQLEFKNFKGSSDTEIITACLEEWGIRRTIEQLDGMFALVIFDVATSTICLARDFAGIKPLFYGLKGGVLVASSQYDQLCAHPHFKNEPANPSVLRLYLQQHFMPAPFGLYQNTHQVRPGEIVFVDCNGAITKEKYWKLEDFQSYDIIDYEKALLLVEETLSSCVRDQLVSDVPLGGFLSGGVDSPLISYYAKKYKRDYSVFSIGSNSLIHDESERAQLFANALGLEQKLWKIDDKLVLDYWPQIMQSLHEPMADFSVIPTFLVSHLAAQSHTVALSGDGGDELFFGYERFHSIAQNSSINHFPRLLKKGIYGFDQYIFRTRYFNSNLLGESQSKVHEQLHSRFRNNLLFSVAPQLLNQPFPDEWDIYKYQDKKDPIQLFREMQKAEFYGMMQKTLRKVDLASMENSLEVRIPFLQKKMIEASLRLHPSLNTNQKGSKHLLKTLLHNKIQQVPQETKKKGFGIPLSLWIREALKNEFQEKLLEGNLENFGFQRKGVEQLLSDHLKGKADYKWPLFTLYALVK
ncbi:MAG: asparagine synthase (glutamine-hydrolyzing) [Flavobacterium sp.]